MGISNGFRSVFFPQYKGCFTDRHGFEDVKVELLDLPLIEIQRRYGADTSPSSHSTCFFDRMSKQQSEDATRLAFPLLREAFPGRLGHHLHTTRWQTCEQLRQHILAFQTQYELLRNDSVSEQDAKYTRLICDTAWSVAMPP